MLPWADAAFGIASCVEMFRSSCAIVILESSMAKENFVFQSNVTEDRVSLGSDYDILKVLSILNGELNYSSLSHPSFLPRIYIYLIFIEDSHLRAVNSTS